MGLEEALTLIVRKAKELRDAGVVGRVFVGDVNFELAPSEPPNVIETPVSTDPLEDKDTFGGKIPRRRGYEGPQELGDG